MNKIVSIKSNAIFLAAILVLGTLATISPSFMVGVQADSYLEMERYNIYEPEPKYPPQYAEKEYNSYELPDWNG